jgi:heme o synthase
MSAAQTSAEAMGPARVWLNDRTTTIAAYFVLTKPRVMSLLLFTTLAAVLVAAREHPLPLMDLLRVIGGTMLGGALASGGAAVLNCYIDRDIDAVMARTKRRAIPAGSLAPRQVLVFGITLSVLAVLVLLVLTTTLAAALALLGNLFYVLVYTCWLKRRTTQNIVIGGVAGAIPPLVGWAAVTNSLALPALLLFVIITYWTPAHFWSLALLVKRDYARAGVPMLPVVASEDHAYWQIISYTLLVIIASLLLFTVHAMGIPYLVCALLLGAAFGSQACVLAVQRTARQARRTFICSNLYLAALFAAMIADRLVS